MTAFSPLTLRSDVLTAHILPFGAALVGLHLAGRADNLVLGFADPQDHARIPVFAGAVVGPVANRIAGGRLSVAGQTHQMPRNEGDTCLHSGPEGLHALRWDVRAVGATQLSLGLTLPDGACGLPGKREITAEYALEGDTLTLTLEAATDRHTAMNLAHHPYWTLDGGGDVSTHRLAVMATHVLAVDAQGLPTGWLRPVSGTAHDFRSPRPVPCNASLDLNYCLSDASETRPRHVATLTGGTGTAVQITTDAPGLQVYNGAFLPETENVLPGGRRLRPFHAMALEPQYWPDAPNNSQFPQITLAPGRLWRQTTSYRVVPG